MTSRLFIKPGQTEQEIKWAKIWFKQLSQFHQRDARQDWEFGAEDVIAFLRSKRDAGMPAWKRLKVIRGLMFYRRLVLQKLDDDLVPLHEKMEQIILIERARD